MVLRGQIGPHETSLVHTLQQADDHSPVASPLGRHPLGGRNWEGFATDPFLTGVAMEQTIIGMQKSGIQACAKHIIGYEQETDRVATYTEDEGTTAIVAPYSSNINDRTMHELYLWPFYNAVRAGVASVMWQVNKRSSFV